MIGRLGESRETDRILPISIAESTPTMHLGIPAGNRRMRTRRRQTRSIPPWADTSVPNWGRDILSFLTCDRDGAQNGGGPLATLFSAIRFPRLIEGRGEFEGESIRIRALIGAARRESGVNQMSPLNPEMLGKGRPELNLFTPTGCAIWAALMRGFHFALGIFGIEMLAGKDISLRDGRWRTIRNYPHQASEN